MRPEIKHNEGTVWVNNERGCIGRFCKVSYEVTHANGGTTTHSNSNHSKDWDRFVDEMGKYHGVVIDERYRPEYARKTCS